MFPEMEFKDHDCYLEAKTLLEPNEHLPRTSLPN